MNEAPDGMPIIGSVPSMPNVYLATGHKDVGISMVNPLLCIDIKRYIKKKKKIFNIILHYEILKK